MDPNAIGPDGWRELGSLLTNLWLVVLFIVLFASNMILGHNMIPSLVASKDIPAIANKTRPVFYLLAIVCFVIAMVFLSVVVDEADVLRRFWDKYWI